ncbi:MAG: hypothetical protein RMM30_11640, partial [Armatimonadota bacterium]|nr:hypothetical protein [Armatimonadota bacterium]MDW8157223.1 hypothetical protein [Armatimonadota bacterium]
RVRDRLTVPEDLPEAEARALALASERVRQSLGGRAVKDVVYVPGKVVNIVSEPVPAEAKGSV